MTNKQEMTESMVNQDNLEAWSRTILEDEFNDTTQNEHRGNKLVSGEATLGKLRMMGGFQTPTLDVGCGRGSETVFDFLLDPCPERAATNPKVKHGWLECLPFGPRYIGFVQAWGVLCFVRSLVESMMEVNRVLRSGGIFVFDVVTYTTMPLAQTVDGPSFIRWAGLFGFELQAQIPFGWEYHRRLGLRLKKVSDFDPARFRMPQSDTGKIHNYLTTRDWFMV